MTKKIILFLSVVLLIVLSLQGIAMQHEEQVKEYHATRYAGTISVDLDAHVAYSTNNTIVDLSMAGKSTNDYMVAWDESIKMSETSWDYDVFTYSYPDGSVKHYGKTEELDMSPKISLTNGGYRVIWEQNGSIISSSGDILSGDNLNVYKNPSVWGNKLAFEYYKNDKDGGNQDEWIGYTTLDNPPGNIKKVDFPSSGELSIPVISDKYLASGQYIYSFANGTFWKAVSNGNIMAIYGDWVITAGRWNFGKSIFIDAINIMSGEYKRIASFDTSYDFFDSLSFDNYLVAFSYDYNGYIYNVLSHKLYKINNYAGDIWHIAIGGGKIAWSDYYGHNLRVADAPDVGTYVEITLKDKSTQQGETYDSLLIIDSQGRKYGYDRDMKEYKEISGVIEINVANPITYRIPTGAGISFKYQVIGMHDGSYDLQIKKIGSATRASLSELVVNAKGISIAKGEIDQYVVDWQKVASNAADAVKLSIDANGDGTFEKEITTSSEITNDAKGGSGENNVLDVNIGGMMCLVGIAVVVIVIVLIVLLVAKKKK